jgi:hypothetical protein
MTCHEKTVKVSGVDQTKPTQAKTIPDDTVKKHAADHHKGAMDEMTQAMTLATQSRP